MAAWLALICVPFTRPLTESGFPAASVLWYSQKRNDDVGEPPVTVHPEAATPVI